VLPLFSMAAAWQATSLRMLALGRNRELIWLQAMHGELVILLNIFVAPLQSLQTMQQHPSNQSFWIQKELVQCWKASSKMPEVQCSSNNWCTLVVCLDHLGMNLERHAGHWCCQNCRVVEIIQSNTIFSHSAKKQELSTIFALKTEKKNAEQATQISF